MFMASFANPSLLRKFCYSIQATNNAIGTPPHFINGRMHLGVEIGLQKDIIQNDHNNKLDFHLSAGYYSQKSLQQNTYLKPSLGYVFKIYKSLCIRTGLQTSLILNRQLNDEFIYSGNGTYKKVSPYRFQFMPSLGISSWIKLFTSQKLSLYPTMGYEFGMQMPFSSISMLLPTNQLKIGLILKPTI